MTTSLTTPLPLRAPTEGSVLGGKYRLERALGRGGTGRVFAATQLLMERLVAVKVLRYDMEPRTRALYELRFLREASRAGALQHPNVVTVHDFDREDDGTCYIVMELVRGRSLSQVLEEEAPLAPVRTLRLFEQVVRGLRAAHTAGLVHRDIKPGNILVSRGEEGQENVKIVDFGLVKGPQDKRVTAEGVFLGTPNYVAPEQAQGLGEDHRSDLYAAGVVMYRCLTGRLPFQGVSPTDVVMAHVRTPYPPMATRAPDVHVPEAVEAIVRRCMAKDPAERYPDAARLLQDLTRVRRSLDHPIPLGPRADEVTTWRNQPLPRTLANVRRRAISPQAVGLLVALAVVLAFVVAALELFRPPVGEPAPPALHEVMTPP